MQRIVSMGLILPLATVLLAGCPEADTAPRAYSIEVHNISSQPLSAVVAAAHDPGLAVWEEGQLASPGIGALAESAEVFTLFDEIETRPGVSGATYTELSIPSEGRTVPRFGVYAGSGPDLTDTQTLEIEASPGDALSLVGGLLGTNDGFWGVDRVTLPESGTQVYFAFGYDAGTEENNEREAWINDAASILGPEPIPGDEPDAGVEPDNRRDATAPPTGIRRHEGILGAGDVPLSYDFDGVMVRITVTREPVAE